MLLSIAKPRLVTKRRKSDMSVICDMFENRWAFGSVFSDSGVFICAAYSATWILAETWKDVERRKWNTHATIEFNDQEAMLGLPIEVESNIDHKRERIMEIRDEKFWARSWNVGEVRNFIEALLPTNHAELDQDPEIQELFKELSEAMGEEEVRRAISWPAVLLLATKK
ncbi:putative S-adenosyl-L-methionine-dependent methyltransferase [Seiridium cardinale]|uniref:S-adenosyl-L-methionine-dependent methyltransferase n=1 Tax=Seiridium cardinale TaxID=138064 RepID=A0ABR2XPB3_9PEZI